MSAMRRRLILCLILLLAAGLRVYALDRHSLWLDEIASLMLSSGRPLQQFEVPTDRVLDPGGDPTATATAPAIGAIWSALRHDTHPPLYLLVLRAWRSIFGDGDIAARSLSLVCQLIAILLLYDTARRLHGDTVALWAAGIMALATPQIEFAQEVRSYSMLVMWSLASANAIVRIEQLGPALWRAVLLGGALLAGLLTHYYGSATVIAIGAYALIRFRGNASQRNIALYAVAGAVIGFLVICGPLLWTQRPNFQNNMTWIADAREGLLWRTMYRISVLPLLYFIAPMKQSMYLAPLSITLLVLPWLILPRRRDLLLWCLLATAAIALAAAADLINASQTLNKVRYTLSAAAPLYAIGAALLAHRRDLLRHAAPAALALSCAAALPQAYVQTWKPDWRGFARELAAQAEPDHVLLLYQSDAEDWYQPMLRAGLVRYGDLSERPLVVLSGPAPARLREQLAAAPGVWIVSGSAAPPIQRLFPQAVAVGGVGEPYVGHAIRIRIEPEVPATAPTRATATTTSRPVSAPLSFPPAPG